MDLVKLLEKTKAAFMSHQGSRTHCHYTADLKNAAVSLLEHYSPVELASQLKISAKSLRNWQVNCDAVKKGATFVPLRLMEDVIEPSSPIAESIILKLPHQLEVILSLRSTKDTAEFICCLMKEISKCSI